MPTFRGNRGNLLQHWVLVELLYGLREPNFTSLCFVDAYTMSPTATRSPRAGTDPTAPEFDRVGARLASAHSRYERAWRSLRQSLPCDYPSSAAFVRHCWQSQLHLLLCEADPTTAGEIASWLSGLNQSTTSFELHRGDWRERFIEIPITGGAYLISFDPNMYDRHTVRAAKRENIYPDDIAFICRSIGRLPKVPTVIQLSTYSANSANSQANVLESIVPHFTALGFAAAQVRADNAMMSLVFSRDVAVTSNLEKRFQLWLAERSEVGAD